jgi:hypothetical protein
MVRGQAWVATVGRDGVVGGGRALATLATMEG